MTKSSFDRAHEISDFGELDPAWEGIRAEWRDIAGTRTRLLRRDGDPDGPLVLCLHGLGGTATNWLEVMTPLSAIGDVVAIDEPGFGETAPPRTTAARPVAIARFVASLLVELDRGPVVLIGNSMGGLIGTLVAAGHPQLVDRLVLLCPALPPHLPSIRVSRYQATAFGPLFVPVLGRAYLRRQLRSMTFEEQYRKYIGGLVADVDAIPDRLVRLGGANFARGRELRWRGRSFREATTAVAEHQLGPGRSTVLDAIERVQAPTLYLRGADDPLVLRATTETVQRLRPDWTIEEPEGLGHVPMYEDPTWTVERIITWLRADVRQAAAAS